MIRKIAWSFPLFCIIGVTTPSRTASAVEDQQNLRLTAAQVDFDQAKKLEDTGKYTEGLVLAERALKIRETVLGTKDSKVAECLNLIGELHYYLGHFVQAETFYQHALQIWESSLGKYHPNVALSLNNIAVLYLQRGPFARAEPLLQRALQIREATLGENHPMVAESLISLASFFYRAQGAYSQAEQLLLRALQIDESSLGPNDPVIVIILNNLSNLYSAKGDYENAESYQLRSKQIAETVLGEKHPLFTVALINLAAIYRYKGVYTRAEQLLLRVLQEYEATLGRNHLLVAANLTQLAVIYSLQGADERATSLNLRALEIRKANLGPKHPLVADSLNNLGVTHFFQRKYQQALQFFLHALRIRETTLGPKHPQIAESLTNIADVYLVLEKYQRAKFLLQRALYIWQATQEEDAPNVAKAFNSLGRSYQAQGADLHAERLYLRALKIQEATLGKHHPFVSISLINLANTYLDQKHFSTAWPLFERVVISFEQRLRWEALAFSNARLVNFLSLLRPLDETLYSVLIGHSSEMDLVRLALCATLLHKGRSVDEFANISRVILSNADAADREAFTRLRALRTQLATLTYSGPRKLSQRAYKAHLEDLTIQGDTLEARLAQRSAPLRALGQLPSASEIIPRLAAALPADGALIEIIAFDATPAMLSPDKAPSKLLRTPMYLGFILFPSGDIRTVDLGPAAPINAAVADLREALSNQTLSYTTVAQKLYRLVIARILPNLGSQHRLFISPDGDLNLVPFGALHDGHHYLLDSYEITYLTSGRDLLPHPEGFTPMSDVVVFANPDFSTSVTPFATSAGDANTSRVHSDWLEHFYRDEGPKLPREPLKQLGGTLQEAALLQLLIPGTRAILGPEATTAALFQVQAPRILHIGTHGFLLQNAKAPSPPSPTMLELSRGVVESAGSLPMPDEPMLHSGLYTAGNNIVTALELSGLNLWGTQLVVLSACDTGLGKTEIGQGVAGLRRAFLIAGAETVVTSLWKVEDAIAPKLMEHFYGNLVAGQGRAEAMHAAMRAIRAEHPHPYYWAPFIVVGKDGPLRPMPPTASPATTTSH